MQKAPDKPFDPNIVALKFWKYDPKDYQDPHPSILEKIEKFTEQDPNDPKGRIFKGSLEHFAKAWRENVDNHGFIMSTGGSSLVAHLMHKPHYPK